MSRQQKKRIVLVEDDPDIRDIFLIVLEKDYQIVALEDGARILQRNIGAPDLFVLDKNISGINGLDLCQFIKRSEKYSNVPVLMLSASPDILELAQEAGADGAVTKPFSIDTLCNVISTHIHR
ncbi:response regulator [Parapedobacter indicus]|uniref:Two-component system, OmpR family, response regulator RpaA n=1 Tax=Parapedobacter indicus TaxID=1477437 RepID=A0A1I3HLS6_9SPHI|nr:response regulator [Parapedobacter indicus]PPL03090.1 response regulator receiver domain-containing protein [Parapedobacter indicus]SFI36674.1 two-component system, OmpR family, response regulator RpaA [Parapedobacter indicus]